MDWWGMSIATNEPAAATAAARGAFTPIGDYGLLADCNSAALVARDGSIDWLCLPRYDSDAIFARILDPDGGHWSIRPAGSYASERRYLPGTLVIETTFTTDTGTVRLTDALVFAEGQRGHELGYDAPHELVRSVEGVSGEVALVLELAPRTEYGLVRPLFRRERVGFSLRWVPTEAHEVPPATAPDEVAARIADTVEGWRSWEADHDIYDGPHRELVRLGSRVLKGLTYRPTGAIVAAPTTSLPETVGGERNWDYRYSWIRDSSLTLEALYIGACSDEAEGFVSFMTSSAGGRASERSLQIMYGISGEHDLSERELPHLRGWRDSAPVRVGNGAWGQTQLDVYGELLNSLYLYREQLGELHPEIQQFVADLANTAARRWRETDAGMWEMRGEPRHHLSSKVLCWVALDRAIELAPRLGEHANLEHWMAEREAIRQAIMT